MKIYVETKDYIQIFIAPFIVIARSWKQPKCLLTGWMDKINCGVSTQWNTTWVVKWQTNYWLTQQLGLISKALWWRFTSCVIPFIWKSQKDITTVVENKWVVSRSCRWGKHIQRSFWDDETVLYTDFGDDYVNLYIIHNFM